jgi:son of sevenless
MAEETLFRNIFMMTFRTLTSPERLFELLVDKYQMDHPSNLGVEEFEEWKEKKLRPTQKRVLTILTIWLENHNLLDEEPHMARQLTDFLSLIVSPEPLSITAKLVLESLQRLVRTVFAMTSDHPLRAYLLQTFEQAESPRAAFGAWGRKKSKTRKNDLLKYHPDEIGEQLCLHEQKLYMKIRSQECLNWGKTQTGRSVTNLTLFCATYEKLGTWVKMSILNTEVLGKRADIVDYWIKVAEVRIVPQILRL